jgi:hypothetical protein
MIRFIFIALSLFTLSGCGPSRQFVPDAAVHEAIPAGQARVLIVRKPNVMLAQGIKLSVRRDGSEVGALAPGGYLAWDQAPGKTLLYVDGEPLPLTLEANKPICIQVIFGAAAFGRSINLTTLDSERYDQLISAYEAPKR